MFLFIFFTRRLDYMGKSTLSWGEPVSLLVGYPFFISVTNYQELSVVSYKR